MTKNKTKHSKNMDVSFGPGAQPVTDVEAVVTPVAPTTPAIPAAPAAPAPAPVSQVPATVPTMSVPAGPAGLVLGDKIPDFKDIILPRVNIVQNIGGLTDSFESGALVLNQTTVLYLPSKINAKTNAVEREASPPVTMVFFGFRPTRYSEKVEGGARGLIVDTEADVRSAGGTLDYGEWKMKKASGMRRFEPLADALVAVQRPATGPCAAEDNDTVFTFDVDGAKYALALWAMKGTAYTALAKRVLFTARATGCLRKGYPAWSYSLSTREQPYDTGNKAWIPVALPQKPTTAAFLEFVKSIIGG